MCIYSADFWWSMSFKSVKIIAPCQVLFTTYIMKGYYHENVLLISHHAKINCLFYCYIINFNLRLTFTNALVKGALYRWMVHGKWAHRSFIRRPGSRWYSRQRYNGTGNAVISQWDFQDNTSESRTSGLYRILQTQSAPTVRISQRQSSSS